MTILTPTPFRQALLRRDVQELLPTSMSSAELSRLDVSIRERSLFSARTVQADHLQEIGNIIDRILKPEARTGPDGQSYTDGMDLAQGRVLLRDSLDRLGYSPDPEHEGTIQDLGSEARLNLILKTNVQMAQGYGQWRQGQDPEVLDAFPAQELIRLESRIEPRDWHTRWLSAAGEVGDTAASAALRRHGRMAARKDSPIWVALSAFGQPYPPFDYNSGMDLRDVGYSDALSLGVITPGDSVTPQTRSFEMEAA